MIAELLGLDARRRDDFKRWSNALIVESTSVGSRGGASRNSWRSCAGFGAIVSNKRLGAVLAQIQADQRKRDQETLTSPKVSLRRKRQIRAARAKADAPCGSP